MIQSLPDPAPFLKAGIVGVLLFIIVAGMVVGGVIGVKFYTLLAKQLDAKQDVKLPAGISGSLAGGRSVEFWELASARIFKECIAPLIELMIRIERNQTEILRLLRNVRANQKREAIDDDDSE